MKKHIKDITGIRFGSLVAIKYMYSIKRMAFWQYKCDCGKLHIARSNTITYEAKNSNKPQFPSCGCKELEQKTKHGFRKAKNTHPLYIAIRGAIDRCYNTKNKNYRFYGAKGVTVCKEWRNNLASFVKFGIEKGWKEGLVIDKDIMCKKLGIEPKIYSPETVIFIPNKVNISYSNSRIHFGIHPNIKLSEEQYFELLRKYDSGINRNRLSKEYGICYSSVNKIIATRHDKKHYELLEH